MSEAPIDRLKLDQLVIREHLVDGGITPDVAGGKDRLIMAILPANLARATRSPPSSPARTLSSCITNAAHASRGGEKLRKQASLARALVVFLKTNPFREDLAQYSHSELIPLPRPTDDSRLIVQAAMAGLRVLYRKGYAYQKCGVMLTDLCDRAAEQFDLMATTQTEEERQRNERLMATLDKLNREHGRGTVTVGRSSKNAAWHLRSQWRTPRYTTRWDELTVVKMQ